MPSGPPSTIRGVTDTTRSDRIDTLNRFSSKYLEGVKDLAHDCSDHALHTRIETEKYYLGYGKNRDASWTSLFVRRLRHPHSVYIKNEAGKRVKISTPRLVASGKRRRRKQHKTGGPLRLRALHVAETLIGVMEHGGNNMGATVSKIIRENGGVGPEPWCGDFVAFCYRHAGSTTVNRMWAVALAIAGRIPVRTPQAGDVVQYSFGHTGLFVRNLGGGMIETIEGNTGASGAVSDSSTGGDGVYRKHRSTSQVTRYVRVAR